ncbi:helix-turn-helix domain-containing protein [Pseudooceanicola marinus]|uniref:helix-turn-helix domain-containing protein n=1 Tax=Pseudooceanicola marinus TaxID=396013 RepID=UPI001CD3E48D|nr:AraC family transcriptional regulator [Pseudooceanicola marinus]MCA1334575.1 AraC family transcriptional regulator [Pseudooceanicola marinus]
MPFLHAMTCRTEGIHSTAPVRWRAFDGMCAVFWEAHGDAGATGYYTSPDPRIILFFNDVSGHIRMGEGKRTQAEASRPMLRAVFAPAGTPMWTRFTSAHDFSHLDLHLERSWLIERLTPLIGAEETLSVLSHPVEVQDIGALAAIGEALRDEVFAPSRHPVFAENLALTLLTGLVELPEQEDRQVLHAGGLTPAQMRRIRQLFEAEGGARISNATLADAVGLSPNWFSQAFKKTTGKTPVQWQQEHRIGRVKEALLIEDCSLTEVASRFGFSDQAHLTRVFRQHEGTTPAAWLRDLRAR